MLAHLRPHYDSISVRNKIATNLIIILNIYQCQFFIFQIPNMNIFQNDAGHILRLFLIRKM